MSNRKFLTVTLFLLAIYFFKADIFYFARQLTLEKNTTILKLKNQNFILRRNILQIPLTEGRIITQIGNDFVVINKTKLPINTAVFGKKSVIGKIVSQTKFTQIVRLITNRDSKVAVFIPEIGRAILKGDGNKKMILTYVDFFPSHDTFKKGDVIYTLGFEGQFPKKQPIAIISDAQTEGKIICHPFEDVDYLTDVSLMDLR